MQIPTNVHGALVSSVDADSPAAEAGLHQGDIIIEIDRKPIGDADTAVELSKNLKTPRVLVRVWRDGGSFFIVLNNAAKK